jgi:hypothetical protein
MSGPSQVVCVPAEIRTEYLQNISQKRYHMSRSQWQRGIWHELSSLARMLGSWVRIPLEAWRSVCVYSVFVLGSGLATG